ncbi:MAG TPA: dephospho-CoA kinase [Mariniphaga anaerophila]|uniref:Dephospho-CoA kinase n=1 Tax=Mariniphaga anaerophila TaxID=1484053 RepID=A0A831PKJ6_9BACT|nr:dephospho-CoA kinase [Mariniphaga anaerophila]
MALVIGITGGIGSGKSTVCRIFQMLGVPVFEADVTAKQLYESSEELRSGLIRLFGSDIYKADGKPDRKKLASIIFTNDNQLAKVNELVHPAVRKEFENWLKELEHFPYVIHEAAILFESGFYKMMDYTILVTAPEDQRIERVAKRDGVDAGTVKKRMRKQWPEEDKQKLADKILVNDNKEMMIPEIIRMDKNIKTHGKIW